MRIVALAMVLGVGLSAWAQAAKDTIPPGIDADGQVGVMPAMQFDVVSFKRCPDGVVGPAKLVSSPTSDSVGYHCQPIQTILYFAYTTSEHPFLMSGEPAWVDTEPYDFQAKLAPEDVEAFHKLNLASRRMMIRRVLAEELKLTAHPDPTPHSVYDLVVGKGELKLTPYKADEPISLPNGDTVQGVGVNAGPDGIAYYHGETMNQFAEAIETRVGRQVIDKTKIPGRFNFTTFMPPEHYSPSMETADDSPIPKIFDGVKALGLNLVSAKEVTGGLVLDHIERPPEN